MHACHNHCCRPLRPVRAPASCCWHTPSQKKMVSYHLQNVFYYLTAAAGAFVVWAGIHQSRCFGFVAYISRLVPWRLRRSNLQSVQYFMKY